jgi:4-alpha-glucanotransferase
MGPWAYKFADFLSETQQSLWQILPLNPTETTHGNSPYHSSSAFACNPLLISPQLLAEDWLLTKEDLESVPQFLPGRVDFESVTSIKRDLLNKAHDVFLRIGYSNEYDKFCVQNSYWLEDFALFQALKSHFQGRVWNTWPRELRDREPGAVNRARERFHRSIEKEKFFQWIFFKQWISLKNYCNEKGIKIIGDVPIYLVLDSADIWLHPELVKLDDRKEPYAVAGVPPDYFSETGQLWGNPVYRWDVLKQTGYAWWHQRIKHNLALFDFIRIDHFRGFVAYWEVDASEKNAVNGKWVEAPAVDFFETLLSRIPHNAIIAEDLGTITPDVREIMERFGFPGMKVLLFAFGPDLPANPYIPHNHIRNCVVYTGTHDNNTAQGWFEKELSPEDRRRLFRYLGRDVPTEKIHWELIRLAMMSVAEKVVFPMQDVLGLGEPSRMNRPATNKGNWQWRLDPQHLSEELKERLREMTKIFGRGHQTLGRREKP